MRLSPFSLAVALVGWLALPAIASAVTIDATALSSPTFRLAHVTSYMSTTIPQSIALGEGTYEFDDEANGSVVFDVDAGGLVSYDPALETYVHGAGTTTLTVRGFDVTFDARTLTAPTFRVAHVFPFSSTASIVSATMLPNASYPIDDSASNEIVFNLDSNGLFQLVPGSEDYLSGAGTSNLVIRGFDITIDARALSSPSFQILGITGVLSSQNVVTLTGIPGTSYGFYDVLSNNVYFEIDPDGHVRYNAPFESFLDGAGTAALKVDGFPISIDACGLAPLTSRIALLGHLFDNLSPASVQSFVGIPGTYALVGAGDLLYFDVDGSGLIANVASSFVGVPVSGAGTGTLTIGNCVHTGSVAGRVVADCPAAGSPLLGVLVDAYEVGSGDLAGSAVTDANGNYTIANLDAGPYSIAAVTPLGYSTTSGDQALTVTGGQAASADFALHCVAITSNPRTIGFWMHQTGVATGGKGQSQVGAAALCAYLDLIAVHFNSNAINQVVVYQPPISGACGDKLQIAKQLLNLPGATAMINRAKQQLMALLLNVAAGYISQTQVISADGATVSQAITYCDNVIDSPTGNYERAKTIADTINNGAVVPAGMIPLGTAQIAYRRGMEKASFRVMANGGGGPREFHFTTAAPGPVRLAIHDVSGRLVAELFRGSMEMGAHAVRWDGKTSAGGRLARGIYFAKLQTPRESPTIKVLYMGAGN